MVKFALREPSREPFDFDAPIGLSGPWTMPVPWLCAQ
jgi:hypothetical protein